MLADELSFKKNRIEKNLLVKYAQKHSNMIITSHIGGMTFESREATDIFIVKKLLEALT